MTTDLDPRSPEYRVGYIIANAVCKHLGHEWSRAHTLLANDVLNDWRGGLVHQVDIEDAIAEKVNRRRFRLW